MRTPIAIAFVLGLIAAVPAQAPVLRASGKLVAAPGTACDPAATHTFQYGDLLLRSSTLDLSRYVNRYVDLAGSPALVANCGMTLDVTEIVETTTKLSTLSFSGYRIGSSMTLLTQAPIGSLVLHLFATEPGMLPALQFGTLFLDPLGTQQWAYDVGVGLPLPRFLSIPANPVLVGLQPRFQALVVDATDPLGSRLTNCASLTIRG